MLSLLVLALVSADPTPVIAPWDVESRLAKIEADHAKMMADHAAMMARQDALEAKIAQCPCIPQVTPTSIAGATTTYVQHADGSLWARTCGPDGCREQPVSSAYNQTGPFFAGGGGCANGQCGMSFGGPMMSGGGCASGNCGGSSGGRGRRGRR